MKQSRTVELGTGLFVLLGLSALLFLTTQTSNLGSYLDNGGYSVTARFNNVGGLAMRAPVTMAGVTIGRVESINFDALDFKAVVTLRISPEFDQIPEDSDASILTAGLLGGQYIGLNPG
ncbi:MAG: MlaD family protein, partial [Gammaproteobacteria bacterium]